MTPNEMLSDLQKLKLLPAQPLHWQTFSPTSLCVELHHQRYVYQLGVPQHEVSIFAEDNQTEQSGDFKPYKTIQLNRKQQHLLAS
ncbi:hypothetical protein [Lactiplantibacillus fabifermentans]|uniref:Uncharacterized protein n=2 Tax=Lactiplantibacillus fabifermentans TaxID=483011 RepID=A0A0R2NSE2_9LACO|nr:hypothetical protein [Lactiplantibacillus fabifermentans]ETY73250.1 hypothetical protein LFAB_13350 [Lactiplantibacillus fabifermentans T30PCM01]KRO28316.1 hypothetical protein DY78_GL002443 [Lactiplantibacillus fabifermentans DSM 21115]